MPVCLGFLQGILAANIFDWGAKACVELYTNGTILDIYREVSGYRAHIAGSYRRRTGLGGRQ
jgi:hypothetical protein